MLGGKAATDIHTRNKKSAMNVLDEMGELLMKIYLKIFFWVNYPFKTQCIPLQGLTIRTAQ